MSFTWWISLILGAVTMVILQVAWCCKLSKAGMKWTAVLALLSAFSNVASGLVALLVWPGNYGYCPIFVVFAEHNAGWCDETASTTWSVVMFLQAGLWFLVFGFVFSFARSDRYEDCVKDIGRCLHGNENDVELAGNVIVEAVATTAGPDKNSTTSCQVHSHDSKGHRLCGNKPFLDGYFIAAQILSLVAFGMSFSWWISLTLGAVTMLTLQVAWCCKLSKTGMKWAAVFALLSAFSNVANTLVALLVWPPEISSTCPMFIWVFSEHIWRQSLNPHHDFCNETTWCTALLLQAVLWFLVFGFVLSFARSDRYEDCAKDFSRRLNDDEKDAEVAASVIVAPTVPYESSAA